MTTFRLLRFGAGVSSFDRFVTPAILITMAVDLDTSLAVMSRAATMYFVLYAALQPVWAVVSDRLGRIAVIRLALLGAGCTGVVCALSGSLEIVVATRAAAGGLFAAVVPATLVWIGDTVAVAQRRAALARILAATYLGTLAASVVGAAAAHLQVWQLAVTLSAVAALAATEQTSINTMLVAVGDADESTANAVVAAGKKYGFVEPREPTDFGELMISANKRPPDQVPNPHDPVGMLAQQAIRNGDQMITVREVVESTNAAGEEVTTVVMQDGSRHVMTRVDPFEFPSRTDFYEIEHFDKDGEWLSRTSSWHELGNDYKYTSVTWPDGSNYTITMDSTGYRRAGFTTPSGGHHSVPVELIDNISLTSNSLMSGLEKHIERGGSLPMLTQESVEKLGSATKFGGPALSIGTTVFDMIMAESGRDACIAAVAGATGAGGGWGGVKLGVYLGGITGSPYAIPPLVILLGAGGAFGAGKIGKFVGDVVCPY
ncbi:MFS transporter [Mycobacterium sp. NAZ190054]|uniref:MFS transporter n=1 Tax=Mycobacterium sp. NAZ190054 TaxID=1747766 RepID=UPI000795C74D|nr:MFS transporter [Mycobacterium sp. NAZ190054]KWX67922.1 hypothetical protein ASJ79_03940 [Mycobacterium sp. NAZ190054]